MRRSILGLGVCAWLAGCSSAERVQGPDDSGGDDQIPTASFLVSQPVSGQGLLTSAGARSANATGPSAAFVSLPLGRVPQGIVARIRNRTQGKVQAAYLVDGGFDPVTIPAQAGDTVELEVLNLAGIRIFNEITVVPLRRPPVIVRTNPPPGKRDIPLNLTMVVVFSEPVDAASLSNTTVQVTTGGGQVAGTISLTEGGTRAEFVSSQLLQPGTTYTVSLSNGITGVNGGKLEPVSFEFTSTASIPLVGMSQILFSACPNASIGECGLFVMNADGSAVRQITEANSDNYDSDGAWSPDGRQIVFSSVRHCALSGRLPVHQGGTCGRDIYMMYTDGSEIVRLTKRDSLDMSAGFPAWRPNGNLVAYAVTRSTTPRYYAIETVVPSSHEVDRQITFVIASSVISYGRPAWSPDGSRLVFSGAPFDGVDQSVRGLYVMNSDGSGLTHITLGTNDGFPSWSPSGARIALQRQVGALNNLHLVDPDGSNPVQLTTTGGLTPTWSPDGNRIAFKLSPGVLQSEIWVMNADGSGASRLYGGFGYLPAWSPFGSVPSGTPGRSP